jgi:hypothetical protein
MSSKPKIFRKVAKLTRLYPTKSDHHVRLCPLLKAAGVLAFQAYAGLLKALLQHAPNFLVIAIEPELKFLLFPSLNVGD